MRKNDEVFKELSELYEMNRRILRFKIKPSPETSSANHKVQETLKPRKS